MVQRQISVLPHVQNQNRRYRVQRDYLVIDGGGDMYPFVPLRDQPYPAGTDDALRRLRHQLLEAGHGAIRGGDGLRQADVVIYAGSLVNPELLRETKEGCQVYDSARMTLEQVAEVILEAEHKGKTTVRLHTGDPCLYGAIREQMDILDQENIAYEVCPGVSSFCAAAAALDMEYTLPGVSQSVVITRMAGRTPVPDRESIAAFAAHKATMVIFLSAGMLHNLSRELIKGGYEPDTPAAIVYKASWPEEKTVVCTVDTLAERARENGITKTALILVGQGVSQKSYDRSRLYHPDFTTGYREGTDTK